MFIFIFSQIFSNKFTPFPSTPYHISHNLKFAHPSLLILPLVSIYDNLPHDYIISLCVLFLFLNPYWRDNRSNLVYLRPTYTLFSFLGLLGVRFKFKHFSSTRWGHPSPPENLSNIYIGMGIYIFRGGYRW